MSIEMACASALAESATLNKPIAANTASKCFISFSLKNVERVYHPLPTIPGEKHFEESSGKLWSRFGISQKIAARVRRRLIRGRASKYQAKHTAFRGSSPRRASSSLPWKRVPTFLKKVVLSQKTSEISQCHFGRLRHSFSSAEMWKRRDTCQPRPNSSRRFRHWVSQTATGHRCLRDLHPEQLL